MCHTGRHGQTRQEDEGRRQVLADVAAGVHHHRLVLRLAAEDVPGLSEVLVVDARETPRGV